MSGSGADFIRGEIRKRVEAGMNRKQCADDMGISYRLIRYYGIGCSFVDGRAGHSGKHNRVKDNARANDMLARFKSGETLESVAVEYGVSRERVRQILKKEFGIVGNDGGRSVIARQKQAEKKQEADARYIEWRGMTKAEYAATPKWAKVKWQMSRGNAVSIYKTTWHISFHDWYCLILPYTENGKRPPSNLWLTRIDKNAPFTLDNVAFRRAADILSVTAIPAMQRALAEQSA